MTASSCLRVLLAGTLLLASAAGHALDVGSRPPLTLGIGPESKPLQTTDYADRILVVTFWASWCGPCLNEMSALERLQQVAGERLAVVSINIESLARFREVRRAQRNRLRLILAHDTDGLARKAWGVGPIPHLFLIDHRGRIAYEHQGYDDAFIPTVVDQINALLQRQVLEPPVSTP